MSDDISRLEAIAAEINALWGTVRNTPDTLQPSIKIGGLLNEASKLIPLGGKGSWLREHVNLGTRTSYLYQRLATYQDRIPEYVTTKTEGVKYVVGLPPTADLNQTGAPAFRRLPDTVKNEALRLRKEGLSHVAVAERLGISAHAVYKWESPEKYHRSWVVSRQKLNNAKVALAEKEQERNLERKAKGQGGSLGVVFADVRRLAIVLDQAIMDAGSSRAKLALREARDAIYQAEDSINQAVRQS